MLYFLMLKTIERLLRETLSSLIWRVGYRESARYGELCDVEWGGKCRYETWSKTHEDVDVLD